MPPPTNPLDPWMRRLLWFVGGYNLLAGLSLLVFYHEGFRLLGIPKPALALPVQLVGVMVALFGVGYWLTAASPRENRHLLHLGFWSKTLGTALGIFHISKGNLPTAFLIPLFLGDIVYLPPFYLILRRLYARQAMPGVRLS